MSNAEVSEVAVADLTKTRGVFRWTDWFGADVEQYEMHLQRM